MDDKDFAKNIADTLKSLSQSVYPHYKSFADNLDADKITDINAVEWELDCMLQYCYDKRILNLFKSVLRKLYDTYPLIVKSYVDSYLEMYENKEINSEE
jgi:hypothetical protein